ncbi:MAG: UDP-N-acetylenolpyruvoylglucosamine reductase [Spirochaetes bacterium GWF1_41_5]|nr:MAG: UDP-N-acetylenolpyruvoylglucosamine reductase [Spirochaetes bacterium GWF1_41_5]
MNARAYEHDFSEIIKEVDFLNSNGCREVFTGETIGFAYKQSVFQKLSGIIISAVVHLEKKNKKLIKEKMKYFLNERKIKKQFRFPSCGSVFRNDYEKNLIAGRIIESCHLKGCRLGGAEVYREHANFIINTGKATARDIYDLIAHVKKTVYEQTGAALAEEVRYIGEF